jgi:hypothetical protein
MKSTKNFLIAILLGLLALSLTSQPSQGADSPITRAEFDALKAKLVTAQKNLDSLKSSTVSIDILTAANIYRGVSDFDHYSGCPNSKNFMELKEFRGYQGNKSDGVMNYPIYTARICRMKIISLP